MKSCKDFIIDSQVHAYERDHPKRPWRAFMEGPPQVTGDDMVAAMDAAGVAGALLISPFTMYAYDASYALEVYEKHPDRFGLIKPFDPMSATIDKEIDDWASTPGVIGVRILMDEELPWPVEQAGLDKILSASASHGLPVNVYASGHLQAFGELARRNANTQLILDHLGTIQPFYPPPPNNPFADLPEVLALSELDNVAIKVSGVCTLSNRAFPYEDIWPPLLQVFERFGLQRCLWGTDWTRAVKLLSYQQSVEAFTLTEQISETERAMLMGGALQRIYNWPSNLPQSI